MASMGSIGNLKAIGDQFIAGGRLSFKVWLICTDQIDKDKSYPSPNINREVATIPLRRGELMHSFTAIDDTLKDYTRGERGELTTEMTNTLELVMGGDGIRLYDFIERYSGEKFIIIYQNSRDTERYIAGSSRRPMILRNTVRSRDKEMTAATFLFENIVIALPKIYVGAIVNQDPVDVPVDSIVLNVERGREQYRIPENTSFKTLVSVTGITKDMYGKHIEILGASTSNPTKILSGDEFVLIEDKPWYSSPGQRIIFRIHDANTLVEVTGTRQQEENIWYDDDEGGIWYDDYGDGIWHDNK